MSDIKSQQVSDCASATPKLSRKDFLSSTEPRWCIGCGTYSTFRAVTDAFATSGLPREKFAVISGIGCSSRFPYYSSTYGFHTIHGRAPTVAMGLKMANPELSVWVITGDGDGLSIGGNHFLHTMRRNPDLKVILFNNQIYGLTKGQASPTTAHGTVTKSTPYGVVDYPMRPLSVAIAAGATFAARVADTDGEMLKEVMNAAAQHKGVAFVEVLINCVIFNDAVFAPLTDKETKAENTVRLKHGQPMVFGNNKDKALRWTGTKLEVVGAGSDGLLVHDAHSDDSALAYLLSQLDNPAAPVPFGIFRQVNLPVYQPMIGTPAAGDFERLLQGDTSWNREKDGRTTPIEGAR